MAFLTKLILLIFTGGAIFAGIKINSFMQLAPLPKLENTWWGPGKAVKENTAIKPFKINIPDEILTDLKNRLNQARPFTPPLEGVQQQYGMNTNLLKEIVDFWKTKYVWREREQFLNKFPQFTTNIQGLDIHFIRVKPAPTPNVQVLPLLLLHGWPGSVREFYELIPLLTTPQKGKNFVFEVIAPSLPGYGFSQAAAKPGLGAAQVGVVFNNLMKRLGFERYYVQGGDWGGIIASIMATIFPDNILGLHSNMCTVNSPMSNLKLLVGSFYSDLIVDKKFANKMYPLSKVYSFLLLETGYLHLQATKPDTVGVALKDSPVGLAAYILEKFTTWTNPEWKTKADGGLKLKYSYMDLLDNVMIYWVTGSITTSMRLYSETLNKEHMSLGIERHPIEIPSACARFSFELMYQPDSLLQERYKQLVQSTDHASGGHFAAFEEPKIMADDVWSAVEKFRAAPSKTK